MDTAMRLTATETAAVQGARLQRPAQDNAPSVESATPQPPAVQVSISAEARATMAAETTTPVAASTAAERPAAAPASTATPVPASDPARARPAADADAAADAAAQGVATARAQAAEQPDAASSSGSPAVQLYLDNAARPANQPSPTALRTSA